MPGALSYTAQLIPRRRSPCARQRPPIPPPAIRTWNDDTDFLPEVGRDPAAGRFCPPDDDIRSRSGLLPSTLRPPGPSGKP
ncbi:hypothetical protein GCM10020366_27120 [Saccharopolyspora gregorii]|uniref:Uncharacterized protein n=1 Tax=Saccharopolyspora gregorii TaxID=33914 RepID=A0ABP6RR08_9PSEU